MGLCKHYIIPHHHPQCVWRWDRRGQGSHRGRVDQRKKPLPRTSWEHFTTSVCGCSIVISKPERKYMRGELNTGTARRRQVVLFQRGIQLEVTFSKVWLSNPFRRLLGIQQLDWSIVNQPRISQLSEGDLFFNLDWTAYYVVSTLHGENGSLIHLTTKFSGRFFFLQQR